MSPAILTETVWALAHPKDGATPVIPDEVVVITTSKGANDLDRDLFTPSAVWKGRTVWQTLRREILGVSADGDGRLDLKPPQVISLAEPKTGRSRALDDIRTPEENAAAAEFILDEVRRITANDDTRLICSIAGGRKTMSALLAAALSLLGRKRDRLTHVLVNDPFDDPRLAPRFFFPTEKPQEHRLRLPDSGERVISSREARLELAEVPFVPLRYLFRDQLGRFPGGFMDLVRTASGLVDELSQPVEIRLDPRSWIATFDGIAVQLNGRDIPFFQFLCERAQQGQPPFANHEDAERPFAEFLGRWATEHPDVNLEFLGSDWRKTPPEADDFRKRLNSLRERLRGVGLGHLIGALLRPHGPLGFPPERVSSEK